MSCDRSADTLPRVARVSVWSSERSRWCAGEPGAREGTLLALRGSALVGRGQRRRSGGANAAGVHAGHPLHRGAPKCSPPANTHRRILSLVTLDPI